MAIAKSGLEYKKFKDEQKKIEKIQSLKELEEDIKRLKWEMLLLLSKWDLITYLNYFLNTFLIFEKIGTIKTTI